MRFFLSKYKKKKKKETLIYIRFEVRKKNCSEKAGRERSNSNYKHVRACELREETDSRLPLLIAARVGFDINFGSVFSFHQSPFNNRTRVTTHACRTCRKTNERRKKEKREKKSFDTIFLLAISSSSTFSVYSARFAVETDPTEDSWLSGGLWCHCHAIHHLERRCHLVDKVATEFSSVENFVRDLLFSLSFSSSTSARLLHHDTMYRIVSHLSRLFFSRICFMEISRLLFVPFQDPRVFSRSSRGKRQPRSLEEALVAA